MRSRKLIQIGICGIAAAVLAGCAGPMSTFSASGPSASPKTAGHGKTILV